MATVQQLVTDLSAFKADLTTALARVQADLDKLKANQADQASIDALAASIQNMDDTVKAFDIPPVPGPNPPSA